MGWFRRGVERLRPARRAGFRSGRSGRSGRPSARGGRVDDAVTRHLTEFARTRRGVEAYVEPQTAVTQTTLLLVAYDGEWTRRRVPSAEWGHAFADHLSLPGYDAAVVGYPQRMRDYNSRHKRRSGPG